MALSVSQALQKAKRQAKKGEFELAKQLYNSVLEKFPENKRALEGQKSLQQLEYNQWRASGAVPAEQINELVAHQDQGKFSLLAAKGEALARRYPLDEFIPFMLGLAYAELFRSGSGNLNS